MPWGKGKCRTCKGHGVFLYNPLTYEEKCLDCGGTGDEWIDDETKITEEEFRIWCDEIDQLINEALVDNEQLLKEENERSRNTNQA